MAVGQSSLKKKEKKAHRATQALGIFTLTPLK
jgi:hypothetical protein